MLHAPVASNVLNYFPEKAENRSLTLRIRRSKDLDPVTTLSPTVDSSTDEDSTDLPYDDDYEDDDDEYDDEFEDPSNKDPSFLKREHVASLMAGENKQTLSRLGHNFEDMVLSCTYRGVSCR